MQVTLTFNLDDPTDTDTNGQSIAAIDQAIADIDALFAEQAPSEPTQSEQAEEVDMEQMVRDLAGRMDNSEAFTRQMLEQVSAIAGGLSESQVVAALRKLGVTFEGKVFKLPPQGELSTDILALTNVLMGVYGYLPTRDSLERVEQRIIEMLVAAIMK
jgi:predicted PP-loop superfamily ATPase